MLYYFSAAEAEAGGVDGVSMLAMTQSDQYATHMRQPQILCVDSDVAGLVLLDAVLSPRGYDVIRVNTGQQAMEVLAKQPIDLVLLGVILPGTDGFTICAQIRADERYRDLPIMMMSALKSREDLLKGIEAGADHYLFKPLDHEEMIARIKLFIKRKKTREAFDRSYRDMNALTALGQEAVTAFNPAHFDLQSSLDKMMGLLVRKTSDIVEKPRTVIVGILSGSAVGEWHHYEYAFQEFNRVKLDFNLLAGVPVPERGKQKILVLNEQPSVLEAKTLIKNFQTRNMPVENGVCYLSHDLCLMALNYGQDIGDGHLHFFRHIMVQSHFFHALSSELHEVGKAFEYSVYALARAAESIDDDTGNHIYRVGEYCGIIAERLGMKNDFIHAISTQAILHDVGKLYTPVHILKKTEPLTAEEAMEARKHTLWGAKIVGGHPHLRIGQMVALNHHERWDGSGYPRGLKGDAIPVEARIAAIADQYDTLRMVKPHKPAIDHVTVTKILNQGDNRVKPQYFDPQVLKAYRETAFLFEEVYNRRKG